MTTHRQAIDFVFLPGQRAHGGRRGSDVKDDGLNQTRSASMLYMPLAQLTTVAATYGIPSA